jgi:hypothetical protein
MNNIMFIKKNTLIKKITKTLKIHIKQAKEVLHELSLFKGEPTQNRKKWTLWA